MIPEHIRATVEAMSPKPGSEEFAYYGNISGVLRGKWYRIPEPKRKPLLENEEVNAHDPIIPKVISVSVDGTNITYQDTIKGYSGRFTLELSELQKNATVQFVESKLSVEDIKGNRLYETKLQGFHFPTKGEVILSSSTEQK